MHLYIRIQLFKSNKIYVHGRKRGWNIKNKKMILAKILSLAKIVKSL